MMTDAVMTVMWWYAGYKLTESQPENIMKIYARKTNRKVRVPTCEEAWDGTLQIQFASQSSSARSDAHT